MPTKEELGQLVAAARRRAGFKTLYQLARETGLSSGQLSLIERGLTSPSIETLERIMAAIGWEVEVIFRPAKEAAVE